MQVTGDIFDIVFQELCVLFNKIIVDPLIEDSKLLIDKQFRFRFGIIHWSKFLKSTVKSSHETSSDFFWDWFIFEIKRKYLTHSLLLFQYIKFRENVFLLNFFMGFIDFFEFLNLILSCFIDCFSHVNRKITIGLIHVFAVVEQVMEVSVAPV